MDEDLRRRLAAALPVLRNLHRKSPDAIILASDLSQPADRRGADEIDSYLTEELLAHSAEPGKASWFFTTLAKSECEDEHAKFVKDTPPGHFAVMVLTEQTYLVYVPE